MRYKAVLFDLDGTLLNTIDDLAKAINAARKMNGLKEQDTELVKSFVGNGRVKMIQRSLANDPGEYDDRLLTRMLEDNESYYNSHCIGVTRPYDGISELIVRLKEAGVKIACISNKDNEPSCELISHFFGDMFDYVAGSMPGVPRKPDPAAILTCMDKLGVSRNECVYIGDSDVDINTAVNAGIDSISCEWGFKTRDFLMKSGAKKICTKPSDLWQLL
ncbi:MAG: HAD-IA family hydrolase [Saccharofermentans sp.]|nr:HAD-IA family hydrolase [Saccharofermentans sp.]